MGSDSTTTVSVDRETTYKQLRRRRNDLDDLEPGERVSMNDVIQDLLEKADRLESLKAAPEGEGGA
jgi:hypothetical protein